MTDELFIERDKLMEDILELVEQIKKLEVQLGILKLVGKDTHNVKTYEN